MMDPGRAAHVPGRILDGRDPINDNAARLAGDGGGEISRRLVSTSHR